MNPTRAVAAIATAVFSLSLAACGTNNNATVATVNGTKISRTDFDQKLEGSPQAKTVLNQQIQTTLIDQYAAENKIEPTDAEIAKKTDEIKAKYPNGQFDTLVKQQGLSEADVRTIFRQQIVLEKAIGDKVKVSDADVKAYYDKNHTLLDKPEQVRARHILVADLKTANEVEAKLKGGTKFEDLAKQYSTDPGSKDKGGELGFFGHNQMVKPFDAVAFTAPVNVVSAPVKSPFGYHIIQVEEKKPALKATLANSSSTITDTLKAQQQQSTIPTFLQQLRAKATIDVPDDRYKELASKPTSTSVAPTGSASAAATAAGASAAPATTPAK